MKKVLLVDDHTSFREMLAFVFDREPGFEVVAQVGSLAEARPKLGGVDLAVVDLTLCDGDGTDLISELYDLNPHGMVLVLTASREREVHAKAVQKGAAGVLHKSASVEDIIGAARKLVAGEPIHSAVRWRIGPDRRLRPSLGLQLSRPGEPRRLGRLAVPAALRQPESGRCCRR